MSPLAASVVVPTFNRGPRLHKMLEALLRQDYAGEYEVIVVDDGSRDGTREVLERWAAESKRVHPIFQPNCGPATARNRGATAAQGAFLAFLDDDCIPTPGWLRLLLDRQSASGCAAVGGPVLNPSDNWVGRYINVESVIDHVVASDGHILQMVTGNAGIRTAVFRELGGFDEKILVAGGEDTEFGLRLRAAGHSIAFAKEAAVLHDSSVDLAGYLRMIYRHGRGRRRLAERFPDHRISYPLLRIPWLLWPIRAWVVRDYARYRRQGSPHGDALRFVVLRYLENLARTAGYVRGT